MLKRKSFERRKQGKSVNGQPTIFKDITIRRLYTIHPNQHECFFLRLLLVNVRPTSFEYLKTVNGTIHDTYLSTTRAGFVLRNIGVSVWNDLPESVRAAVSLASFKRMVKFHFFKKERSVIRGKNIYLFSI